MAWGTLDEFEYTVHHITQEVSQMHMDKPGAIVHLTKELFLHLHQRKSGEHAPEGS